MIKTLLLSLLGLLFSSITSYAQQGLEKVIVEKYYISNAYDTSANNYASKLPQGSVTYRIFADLLPGYKFSAAYGSPEHTLKIATTTTFFNNIDHGATIPNIIPYRTLRKNTVMLDSWLSVGAKIFDGNHPGGLFEVKDGAWACLEGSKGADSLTNNRVLIAQITTDGELSFELNIQVASPIRGVSQRFVARNPLEDEICIPSLIYTSGK